MDRRLGIRWRRRDSARLKPKHLGLILTLGVTCCMLTALVFLPALLHVQSIRRQKQLAAGPVQEVRRAAA